MTASEAKVHSVRSSTALHTAPHPPCDDDDGCNVTYDIFAGLIVRPAHLAPNKNCTLDLAPTWLVNQFLLKLLPFSLFS